MIALTRLPARTFGTLMSLEPCMGAFLGIVFLNEHLTMTQWLALLCIVCASIGSTSTAVPKSKIEKVS